MQVYLDDRRGGARFIRDKFVDVRPIERGTMPIQAHQFEAAIRKEDPAEAERGARLIGASHEEVPDFAVEVPVLLHERRSASYQDAEFTLLDGIQPVQPTRAEQ